VDIPEALTSSAQCVLCRIGLYSTVLYCCGCCGRYCEDTELQPFPLRTCGERMRYHGGLPRISAKVLSRLAVGLCRCVTTLLGLYVCALLCHASLCQCCTIAVPLCHCTAAVTASVCHCVTVLGRHLQTATAAIWPTGPAQLGAPRLSWDYTTKVGTPVPRHTNEGSKHQW